jgi:hypothetical protein
MNDEELDLREDRIHGGNLHGNADGPVHRYLSLSVGHLPEAERYVLHSPESDETPGMLLAGERRLRGGVRVVPHNHGGWVRVPSGEVLAETYDELRSIELTQLAALLAYAHTRDCDWVNFDVDAGEVDGLPLFDS